MEVLLILAAVFLAWLFFGGGSADTTTAVSGGEKNALDDVTEAIARMEGFPVQNSLAQRTNNPGDIGSYGGRVASYSDVGDGMGRSHYLGEKAHAAQHPDWDFYDMFHYYLTGDTLSPGGPGQNPDAYAEYVANYVGVDPATPVSSVIG